MRFQRSSGILLHITSLPSEFGIGDLGEGSFRFVDFLQASGQSIWQVLPLSPPAYGDSPYSSYSAFAGNPMIISPNGLARDGLLSTTELCISNKCSSDKVDYACARNQKLPLLEKAYANFRKSTDLALDDKYRFFCKENEFWLEDYARFTALAEQFGTANWSQWDKDVANREPAALKAWDEKLAVEIDFVKFLQFTFSSQWSILKSYANSHGVQIFGDMPIFVAYESSDVWANQDLFFLDEDGRQTVVAGVPPDYFSETGQRWGNPLYRWDRIAETNYEWWTNRFRAAFENFDLMRIDHFRGFESYWEVQADCPTAIDGKWQPGPGAAPFLAAQLELGELPIIAEDLGMITDEVHALRDQLDFPGMRVFQFGFDDEKDPYHRPEGYPAHSAAYTGTHDNDTIMGWYAARRQQRDDDVLLDRVVAPETPEAHLEMIRAVFGSESEIAIVPMQDALGLGSAARMNTPGEPDGNWTWRCASDAFSEALADELRTITESSNRVSNCLEVAPV